MKYIDILCDVVKLATWQRIVKSSVSRPFLAHGPVKVVKQIREPLIIFNKKIGIKELIHK